MAKSRQAHIGLFQSTPLMRGETALVDVETVFIGISIHSPHARGDSKAQTSSTTSRHFNPLPSCEGRPSFGCSYVFVCRFQSTPLMRGETTVVFDQSYANIISIHSPHARGDPGVKYVCCLDIISIHSPHARGDGEITNAVIVVNISIHSPHARGDSINFQRIHRIQGSLYNTIHFT